MASCPQCHAPIVPPAVFCGGCGLRLGSGTDPVARAAHGGPGATLLLDGPAAATQPLRRVPQGGGSGRVAAGSAGRVWTAGDAVDAPGYTGERDLPSASMRRAVAPPPAVLAARWGALALVVAGLAFGLGQLTLRRGAAGAPPVASPAATRPASGARPSPPPAVERTVGADSFDDVASGEAPAAGDHHRRRARGDTKAGSAREALGAGEPATPAASTASRAMVPAAPASSGQAAASAPVKPAQAAATAPVAPATQAAAAPAAVALPGDPTAAPAAGDPAFNADEAARYMRAGDEQVPPTAEELDERERASGYAGEIRDVVRSHQAQIATCYERAFKTEAPARSARVELAFTIDDKGMPQRIHPVINTSGSEGLGACLAQRLQGWRFPRPPGGPFDAVYPFVFAPGGR